MQTISETKKKSIPSLTNLVNLPPLSSHDNVTSPPHTKTMTDLKSVRIKPNQNRRSVQLLDQHVKFSSDMNLKSGFFKNPERSVNATKSIIFSTKDTLQSMPQTFTSMSQLQQQQESDSNINTQKDQKAVRVSKTLLKIFSKKPVEQNEKKEDQQNTDIKLLPSSEYQVKKKQFYDEVRELETLINSTKSQKLKPRRIKLKPRRESNMFYFFQPLIQLSVLNEDYHQFQKYRGINPIILREYRSQEFQESVLQNNGTGLVMVECFGVVSILPSLNFKVKETECYKHPMDINFLADILKELILYQIKLADLREQEIKQICKEMVLKHCFFAQNYKSEKIDFLQSYRDWSIFKKPLDQLKDNQRNFGDLVLTVQLGHQQIESPEIIFNPSGKNRYFPSLQDIIKSTLRNYSQEEIKSILSNVVCYGSYCKLKGFKNRLQSEIKNMYKKIDITPEVRVFSL